MKQASMRSLPWETIRVRKDSRTLEEMDIASHPVNFMDDLRDVPVQGIRGEKEDVPWDTDGPEKAAFGRELPGQTEQAAFGQELSEQRISGLSTEPEEESWQPRKPEKEEDGVPWEQKIPVRAQEKEDIPSSYVPQFPKEDISVSGGQVHTVRTNRSRASTMTAYLWQRSQSALSPHRAR